jgi:hypothetical protein
MKERGKFGGPRLLQTTSSRGSFPEVRWNLFFSSLLGIVFHIDHHLMETTQSESDVIEAF